MRKGSRLRRLAIVTAAMAMLYGPTIVAQTRSLEPQAVRLAEDAAGTDVQVREVDAFERTVPLASRRGQRLLSRNEAYNRQRAAEGRVGVRLGDDMSFAINE